MGLLEKSIDAVETVMEFVGQYMIGRDLASYCDLVTAVGLTDDDLREYPDVRDPHILVTNQNAMLSVFDVQGTFRLLSDHEFETIIGNLRMKLGSYMRSYGHSLSVCLERDPGRAHDELMRLAEPQINTARRIGIAAEDIVLSRVDRNAPLVAWEQNLLMIYTHMGAMSPEERKRVLAERGKESMAAKVPHLKYGQHPASVLAALKYRHDSFVERVREDFLKSGLDGEGGILVTRLSAHDAARVVRIQVDREHTSQKWRPVLPGDRVIAHGAPHSDDYSDVDYPKLNYQIVAHDVETHGEFVKSDSLYHATVSMELGPQEPQPFQVLLDKLQRSIPWRIRFDLEPGGLDKARGRRALLSFVGMFPGNELIRNSFEELAQIDRDDPICTLRVVASTWGETEALAKERRAALEKAMQSWGVCQMRTSHGDPMQALASSIAGFSASSVANMNFPPLVDALTLMPFQRPATPWAKNGTMVQRTLDGKIFPVGLATSLQDTDIRVISAPPGSGKSVMLNCMNLASTLKAGARRLPLMTIIDVGFSSTGYIEMLRDGLPDERKNEAVAIRLTNDLKFAVNPFDTQLGALGPTRAEADYLVDFVGGLLMNPQKLEPPSADSGRLASMLVKSVYKRKMKSEPERFEFGVEPTVDSVLEISRLKEKQGAEWWEEATWLEVRDLLFANGHRSASTLCHFRAMPTLPDLSSSLLDAEIAQLFKTAMTDTGEPILNYAQRAFSAAAEQYAIFAGRTRFELSSEARVVALDLQSVIGSSATNEGKLRTSIMYLFARHVGARNYFLDEEELFEVLPRSGIYDEYHRQRLADIKDEQKTVVYDELHNIGYKRPTLGESPGLTMVSDRMVKDGRENRKWGVSIAGSSQFLEDYPDSLLNAASSVYVMRGGNSADAKILRDRWKVSDECIRRLNRDATGPGPQGGNYLALFRTKVGTITQMLTNTPGALELWAFSTTPKDMALRRRLAKALGIAKARTLLAKRFKTGSAVSVIEAMEQDASADTAESVIDRLARQMLEEYHASILHPED